MSTQYLSFGIVDGRTSSDQEIALLRTVELSRAQSRAASRRRRRFRRTLTR